MADWWPVLPVAQCWNLGQNLVSAAKLFKSSSLLCKKTRLAQMTTNIMKRPEMQYKCFQQNDKISLKICQNL